MHYRKLLFFIFMFSLLSFSLLKPASADTNHEGDIILTGNDVLVIEDTTYTQTGNIYVKDNAKLTIRNSTLMFIQRHHEEFRIQIQGNGILEVISSAIDTNIAGECILIVFIDSSNLEVQNSSLAEGSVSFWFGERASCEIVQLFRGNATISNTKFAGLDYVFSPLGGGTVSVLNSYCNELCLSFRDNYHGNFFDLRPGLFEDWTYNDSNTNITFQNTSFNNINAASDGPSQIVFQSSEIYQFAPYAAFPTISMKAIDSIIHMVPLGLWDVSAQLWGLKTGMHSYWKLSDHASGDSLPELILENTDIKMGWLVSGNASNLSIDDSTIERLGPYGPDNNFTVTNSFVNLLMLYDTTNTVLSFDNTTIKDLDAYVPPNYVVIEGNISFTQDAEIKNWYSPSNIRRVYPVLLEKSNGNIISDANLSLYSNNDELLWTGMTDSEGKASFEIEFNDDNYTDSWKLVIEYDSESVNKEIKLLSSTPIGLHDPPPTITPTAPSNSGGSGCFIATAAYGSYMEPHVVILRDFRDRFLLTNPVGKAFVDCYYTYSPPVADSIARNETLQAAVRLSLLPAVGVSWISLNIGSIPVLFLIFFVGSGLIILPGFRRKCKKR